MIAQESRRAAVSFSTLVDMLRFRAEYEPDRTAYAFLQDGESDEVHVSYGQLDLAARTIGATLEASRDPGQPALLLYPPGQDFIAAFFGCLYGGMIAVPTYPPHPGRSSRALPRLEAILETARPRAVLTTSELLPGVKQLLAGESGKSVTCCVATDQVRATRPYEAGDIQEVSRLSDRWQPPAVSGDSLALIQYTSGSTGVPHGVMVSHTNLLHNSEHIRQLFQHTADSRGLIWLPPYHDMGLIGGIIQPLYAGFEVTLMSPLHFLQRPLRWLRAVSRTRATTSGGPNFAYDLCVEKIVREELNGLDLSSWDVAFTGAEPIRGETLERFSRAFAPCGFRREAFYPCYGLAEATLIASGGAKSAPYVVHEDPLEHHRPNGVGEGAQERPRLVGCGRGLADQELAIVDPERLTRCGSDQVGEVWIRGASVAQGYWNRPERTRDTFGAFLADSGEGPFLRTGDLGFVKDGELFVTGRLKDLIIINGRNHYPQDIEETVQRSHPAIRPYSCAAFSIERDEQEQLFIVTEIERQYGPRRVRADLARSPGETSGSESVRAGRSREGGDLQDIMRAIRRAVAERHDLRVSDVRLLKRGTIMKTSSGKIQRHACRTRYLEGTLDEV